MEGEEASAPRLVDGEGDASSSSGAARRQLPEHVVCPFCGGSETSPLATYGSLLMTSQYACQDCRTTFEWVRQEGD